MPAKISERQKAHYRRQREIGLTIKAAAAKAGVSYSWAKAYERGMRGPREYSESAERDKLPGPIAYEDLGPEAKLAWDDFEYFCRRYVGLVLTPWQVGTANRMVEWLASDERQYVVENCPPGVGKTTLSYGLAAWVTVRDRRIRGLFGSRAERNAIRQTRRLRKLLERTTPVQARPEYIEKGLAIDAEATLAHDFGIFKPSSVDVWRAEEFIVAQHDDLPIEEKEPTWSSYGMDSGVLGNRFDLIIWDDVVDKRTLRTAEAVEKQRIWWGEEAETRLEPGGVLFLIGQRMQSNDLYRFCLDKRVLLDDDDEEGVEALGGDGPDGDEAPRLYQHVTYQAHDDARCRGRETHARKTAKAWPDGCLLDPMRLSWSDLRNIKATKPQQYQVQYQQEDADPEGVLIPEVWIWGGIDPTDGSEVPGCVDTDRDICSPLPDGFSRPFTSIATVDPSGTGFWAVQWYVTANAAGDYPVSFLMDLERQRMQANELLDWNATSRSWYGLMEEWQQRSKDLGYPITHWVIEVNAFARHLTVYDHFRRWMARHRVSCVPHTTHRNKSDADLGVTILRDPFKYGRIRLPGSSAPGSHARLKSVKLITELTRWPHGGTTDQVMACWFHELHRPKIAKPQPTNVTQWRPSWLAGKPRDWIAYTPPPSEGSDLLRLRR